MKCVGALQIKIFRICVGALQIKIFRICVKRISKKIYELAKYSILINVQNLVWNVLCAFQKNV